MFCKWLPLIFPLLFISLTFAKPNFVIFLVDDLGIADLGCFGNDTIKTPNIDRLATEGARLRHDVTPDSICTPNRAAILTGRYPIRSGLAAGPGEFRVLIFTAASGGLPQNETTFAEVVSQAGYKTGLIGKWHLGLHSALSSDFHFHPLKQGFHYFYGLPLSNVRDCEPGHFLIASFKFPLLTPTNILIATTVLIITLYIYYLTGLLSKFSVVSLVSTIVLISCAMLCIYFKLPSFNCFVMRNYEVVEQPTILENLTARFTDEAVDFIQANKDSPFLLYMSFAKVHTALFTTPPFKNHSRHGRYGDNVEEMDWSVGQIMSAINELGLKENTFVYFSSDNGPHLEESVAGEYHGGWKGIYKGGKGQAWDGGVRVPTIVSWPNHIAAGISIHEPTSSMDLWPTVAKLAEVDIPGDRIIDGKDFLPLLTNKTQVTSHDFFFHYCGKQVNAVRYRPKNGHIVWKAHFMSGKWSEGTEGCAPFSSVCVCYGKRLNIHDPPLLYDVTNDPSESQPITTDRPEYREVMSEINSALQRHKEGVLSVPSQLGKNSFYPWLQTCCNFPFCSCKESDRNLQHYP